LIGASAAGEFVAARGIKAAICVDGGRGAARTGQGIRSHWAHPTNCRRRGRDWSADRWPAKV